MKISFARDADVDAAAFVVDEGGGLPAAAEALDGAAGGVLSTAFDAGRFSGKLGQTVDLVLPRGAGVKRVLLIGGGKAKQRDGRAYEGIGAALVKAFQSSGPKSASLHLEEPDGAARAALGARLASYRFDKYRSKQDKSDKPTLGSVVFVGGDVKAAKAAFGPLEAAAAGTELARDLMQEPPNVLYPDEFAKRLKALEADGLDVEILDESAMGKLGMNALLGVGQGSVRESRLAVMRWNGGRSGEDPVALVGKGVCFDTGGISLKPGPQMEDMKGDMGGAAAVAGAMKALALRKAKVNVIGLVGLVENMPDGNAQRPGDIVTSASGQTIEIQNTDAEGRLVLADVLWYAQEIASPRAIVDLATLTGAIVISLGHERAGVFTNSDKLASALSAAGDAEGELVWRMPLGDAYDRLLKSKFADMRNIGGRAAGSITAAQFLQRFVNKGVDWAHIDIAGVAWREGEKPAIDVAWASGFGPRLLSRWIADAYES